MEERLAKEAAAGGSGFGASTKKTAVSPRSAIAVHDRVELKKMSNKLKKTKEKEKKFRDGKAAAALLEMQE